MKIKSDYDAFCRLKSNYSAQIAEDDISDVWKFVHESMASLNLDGKFAAACSKIEDILGRSSTDQAPAEGGNDDVIPSEPQFGSFVLLCEDMFHISILENIWKSLPYSVSGEEKFDLAVMLAVERLSDGDNDGTSSHDDSRSSRINGSQADDLSLPLYDPNRKPKRKIKRNKIKSSQKAVLDMLEETFQGTGISLDIIQRVAEMNDYDPEQSIEGIWADFYRSHSLVREGVTFAEAAASDVNPVPPLTSVSSALSLNVSVTVPPTGNSLSIATTTAHTDDDRFLSDAAMKSRVQGQNYHRLADHFLSVARKYNPTYNISLNRGTLSFDGTMRSSRSIDFDEDLRVDLHGLVVLRALELVESVMNYLSSALPVSKSGKSRQNKKWRVKFVVGRGAHSSGGVAKLKPAVEKYLRRNGENNVTVLEGEVHVELRSRSS
jgi:hypothetical protein